MKSIAVALILGMLAFVAPAQAVDLCDCKGYSGPGGPCYAGVGGPCYPGPGGDLRNCPAVCE
jgi:hypothetical protein